MDNPGFIDVLDPYDFRVGCVEGRKEFLDGEELVKDLLIRLFKKEVQ